MFYTFRPIRILKNVPIMTLAFTIRQVKHYFPSTINFIMSYTLLSSFTLTFIVSVSFIQVIWTLRHAQITDILIYLVSSDDEEAYYIYVLEILSLLLREQNPEDLANAAPQRSETEKIRDEAELLAIRHRESSKKSDRIRKFTGARY